MTELFGMLKTYELEMIQAKERSSSYQTASTSTTTSSALHSYHSGPSSSNYYPPIVTHPQTPTSQSNNSPFLLEAPPQTSTSAAFVSENSSNMSFIKEDLECFHPDDLEENGYTALLCHALSKSKKVTPPTQTAACAAVATADFDWSFQYEDIPSNNQALMVDTSEVPPQLKATRAELADQKVHVKKYEFASKKLHRLLDAQIHEKVTAGLGFQAEQPYNVVPPPADYVAIHEPSFNLSNLDMANQNLDPVVQETLVQECTTSSESESTCSDSTETNKVSSPPTCEVIKANNPSRFIPSKTVPVSQPTKQMRISYPSEGRKLNVEKEQSSTSTNSKPQSKSIQQRKVFDICHAPRERAPYVQKTLEEATFEHNKAHPWNLKDLFKRKDYVYFQRDKLAKSCFLCGKYNHTASTCFYYLQQQRNLKQHAFEKKNKNKKVRSFEVKATQFRNSISPPRKHLPKPQQSCIICGESDHFAINCKFNPLKQVLHQIPLQQKPISKMKKGRHTSEIKPRLTQATKRKA
ncbi:hypothetical protein L1987_18657 [Smallanthus sonchifolius]|uniref:Uncharacterized protein n=1 Tax=Smallanthus sonchifolius TaxID=185202 RepID=A0ACB9J0P3_9ASTR|nr:hypothetical protein L1987_18657 [Smallanthus sonchifolius]